MRRAYGFDVALSIFILMWSGLVLNLKRRPLLDAVFALLATVMAAQAIRFVSFIGILGFPIMVRAWLAVADTHVKSLLVKRRPLLEASLFALIFASTLVYGFPLDKVNHRRIDWGFGGRFLLPRLISWRNRVSRAQFSTTILMVLIFSII